MDNLIHKRLGLFREIRRKKHCYLFMLPTLVLIAIFGYYPAFSAFYHSFFQWDGYTTGIFIGFENYTNMIHDPALTKSISNIVILTVWGVILTATVPLLVAEAIFWLSASKARNFFQFIFVAPVVIPYVVVWLIWQFFYDPVVGLFNAILGGLGLPSQNWLGNSNIALYCLMFLGFPWVNGVAMLIYLAGLQSISPEIFDAVRIDGASSFTRFIKIDIPLIMGQIKLWVILTIIGSVQGFALQLIMTNGGPGYATMVPGLWMYLKGVKWHKMGYGCAVGVFLFVIIFFLTYLNSKYIRVSTEYESS